MRRPKWEYHLEPAKDIIETRLNALGSDGWELVTINDLSGVAVFKRPGPTFAERITIEQRQQLDAANRNMSEEDSGS